MPVNLDELAAARREATREPPTVIFKGQTFELPPEPDGRIIDLFGKVGSLSNIGKDPDALAEAAGIINELCTMLLGDSFDAFMALRPSLMDLMALAEAFPELYGMSEGESQASPPS